MSVPKKKKIDPLSRKRKPGKGKGKAPPPPSFNPRRQSEAPSRPPNDQNYHRRMKPKPPAAFYQYTKPNYKIAKQKSNENLNVYHYDEKEIKVEKWASDADVNDILSTSDDDDEAQHHHNKNQSIDVDVDDINDSDEFHEYFSDHTDYRTTNNKNIKRQPPPPKSKTITKKSKPKGIKKNKKIINKKNFSSPPRSPPIVNNNKMNKMNKNKIPLHIHSPDDIHVNNLEDCNLENLLNGIDEGTNCLKDFSNALKKYSEESIKLGESHLKLLNKSRNKYKKLNNYMPNFIFGTELIHNFLQENISQQMLFNKFIIINVLPKLISLEEQCKLEYNKGNKKHNLYLNNYNKLENEYKKLNKQTQNASELSIKDRNNIKNYENAKNIEKNLIKIENNVNNERENYIKNTNKIKQSIINMEFSRISNMLQLFNNLLIKHNELFTENNKTLNGTKNDIKQWMNGMDSKSLVQSIVLENIEKYGKWNPPKIKNYILPPTKDYKDMFYSLEDGMNITIQINKNAKIPLIVPLLCNKIIDLNGFKTEGIFRKKSINY